MKRISVLTAAMLLTAISLCGCRQANNVRNIDPDFKTNEQIAFEGLDQ